MFIPIRTDRQLRNTPWLNGILIAINLAIFWLSQQGGFRAATDPYMLDPTTPELIQFISYQFLHADWMHVIFNMLFLYVFGNSVEDRLGKVGYLGFYLCGGVVAGVGHALVKQTPVLGASGSVAAVTGAYLALFPLSNVTIFYWIVFLVGTFEISGMLLILFRVGQDLVFEVMNIGGVAYIAHLAGYLFGFSVGLGLLKARLLKREPFDMLSLLEQRRRRAQFRSMSREGSKPWTSGPTREPSPADGVEQAESHIVAIRLREQIANALGRQASDEAAGLYEKLLEQDSTQVLSQENQLDLANHLMQQGRYDVAARAYELFLKAYGSYAQHEQVELILGLLYARYLDQPERARALLAGARPRLNAPEERKLADQILEELG